MKISANVFVAITGRRFLEFISPSFTVMYALLFNKSLETA